ncbi:uncharacterized protein METZ01_LOCUS272691, partial [marine metagenome]
MKVAVSEIAIPMIKVKMGNGEVHTCEIGTVARDFIMNILGRKHGAVAVLIDGIERDFSHVLETDCSLEPILEASDDGLYILRHSCAHLLAQAVTEMFPDAKPTIGPPIEHGFYYDFHMEPISEDQLPKIEKRMKKLAKQNLKIEREEHGNTKL